MRFEASIAFSAAMARGNNRSSNIRRMANLLQVSQATAGPWKA